jgi:hypothetical protein
MHVKIISNTFSRLDTMAKFYAFYDNALVRFVTNTYRKITWFSDCVTLDWYATIPHSVSLVSIHIHVQFCMEHSASTRNNY